MKIKGISPEGLDKVINAYYLQHKEIIDVWRELMVAVQTDIELNSPEQSITPSDETVPEVEIINKEKK